MIAFVTEPAKPDITPDDDLAAALLRASGHTVRGIPWTSPDAVVIRSTWN